MRTVFYLKTGAIFFSMAVFAIGIIHLVIGGFPAGLLPVPASLPGKTPLVYLDGIALAGAGALMMTKKYRKVGAMLAIIILSLLLLVLHIPMLIGHIDDANEWTGTFEVASLLAGALTLMGVILQSDIALKNKDLGDKLAAIARYLLAIAFFVFGMLHFKYEKFIETLLPTWMPFITFWCYLVMVSFFALFVSFVTNKLVTLSSLLLSIMFFIWVLILHGPLVTTHLHVEPQWTSFFVALAMCAVGLLVYSSAKER